MVNCSLSVTRLLGNTAGGGRGKKSNAGLRSHENQIEEQLGKPLVASCPKKLNPNRELGGGCWAVLTAMLGLDLVRYTTVG